LTTQERRVFECLAGYAAGIPDGGFDAQSMTLLVNAFARANIKDSELFSRIAGVARRLDTDSQFDAQVNLLRIRWAAPPLFHVGNHKICRILFTTRSRNDAVSSVPSAGSHVFEQAVANMLHPHHDCRALCTVTFALIDSSGFVRRPSPTCSIALQRPTSTTLSSLITSAWPLSSYPRTRTPRSPSYSSCLHYQDQQVIHIPLIHAQVDSILGHAFPIYAISMKS